VSGKKGIKITANNVTLDLRGFALIGNGVGDDAIFSSFGGTANLAIHNGFIRDWIKEGIDGYYSSNCRIENVQVENSVGGYAIITGASSVITGCTVRGSAAGFVPTVGSTVRDCVSVANGVGFLIGSGNTIIGCSSQDSTGGYGFSTSTGNTLSQCTATHNLGTSGFGFDLGGGNTVTGCTASLNDQDGFHVQTGATNVIISGCNAFTNKGNGIKTENGVGFTITQNNCSRNNLNGIQISGGSLVQNNVCEDNGTLVGNPTSGIFINFSYNRIDGNHVLGSTYGIATAPSGTSNNLVIRNTATLCTTPYSLSASTTYGPIDFLATGPFAENNSFANLKF
jgi:parallel beta-helix repeat protein